MWNVFFFFIYIYIDNTQYTHHNTLHKQHKHTTNKQQNTIKYNTN